jgi:hypothetical protein
MKRRRCTNRQKNNDQHQQSKQRPREGFQAPGENPIAKMNFANSARHFTSPESS